MNFAVTKFSSYVEGLPREDHVRYQVKLATVKCDVDPYAISLVKKLCYPEVYKFSSAWGCEHEVDAIQDFLDSFTVEHVAVEFSRCGLTVNVAYPFLGASPDGIVSCSCYGRMLVEVKCPYRCSCQHLQEVSVHAKDFC